MKCKRKLSIRWGIFGGFIAFTAIILALLWIFQILMLDTFYKNIKIREIRAAGDKIAYSIEREDLPSIITDITTTKEINVLITAENGIPLISSPYSQTSVIFRGMVLQYAQIYQETKQAGGTIFQGYHNDLYSQTENDDLNNMILAHTVTLKNGSSRLILLHSNLTPVESTVGTLRVLLFCITGVMLLLGAVLAIILATGISKPIIRINNSAKVLGNGNYSIRFAGSRYKELDELAQTMNYTADELSKTENLRRELIANVSHDLRTPLTMIEGYSEVMRDIPGENTPENVQIIIDETTRLTTIVNDMLDLSKLQSGVIPLQTSYFSLTENLRETISRFSKLSEFSFSFECDREITVFADSSKISQVIYNLINNAIVHSGSSKEILIRQTVKDKIVRVEITDHGPGIPTDKLEEIWNRYYKADRTEKNSHGSGLGLSIVRTILNLHHASYGVQSELGTGSTFWFELLCYAPPDSDCKTDLTNTNV